MIVSFRALYLADIRSYRVLRAEGWYHADMALARYRIHQLSADAIRRKLYYGDEGDFSDPDKAGEEIPTADISEITFRMKKKGTDADPVVLELLKSNSKIVEVDDLDSTWDFLLGANMPAEFTALQGVYACEIRVKLTASNREVVVDEFEVEYRKRI